MTRPDGEEHAKEGREFLGRITHELVKEQPNSSEHRLQSMAMRTASADHNPLKRAETHAQANCHEILEPQQSVLVSQFRMHAMSTMEHHGARLSKEAWSLRPS